MKCQARIAGVEHSNPATDPETFTVTYRSRGKLATRTECLAHAQLSEARGLHVEVILTSGCELHGLPANCGPCWCELPS